MATETTDVNSAGKQKALSLVLKQIEQSFGKGVTKKVIHNWSAVF